MPWFATVIIFGRPLLHYGAGYFGQTVMKQYGNKTFQYSATARLGRKVSDLQAIFSIFHGLDEKLSDFRFMPAAVLKTSLLFEGVTFSRTVFVALGTHLCSSQISSHLFIFKGSLLVEQLNSEPVFQAVLSVEIIANSVEMCEHDLNFLEACPEFATAFQRACVCDFEGYAVSF